MIDRQAFERQWNESLVTQKDALRKYIETYGIERALTLLIKTRSIIQDDGDMDNATIALAACIGIMEAVQSLPDEAPVKGANDDR